MRPTPIVAEAYAAAVRGRGRISGAHTSDGLVSLAKASARAMEEFQVHSVVATDYMPKVPIVRNSIWDKIPENTKDFLTAILSARHDTDRFFKTATNSIMALTGCSRGQAMDLAIIVCGLTWNFTSEERAAIRKRWTEALNVDRKIHLQVRGIDSAVPIKRIG